MKRSLYSIFLILLFASCSSEKIERNDDVQFLDRYVQLGKSLFKDNGRKVSFQSKKAVTDLENVIKEMESEGMANGEHNMDKIISLFNDISKTNDIAEQRMLFKELTDFAKKAAERVKKPLYLQYCPMAFDNAGAEWISESKAIENPYFGPEMPACGTTKKIYNENELEEK